MAITGSTKPRENPVKLSSGSLSGFRISDEIDRHRLLLNIQGLEKTGKNHFSFSMPGPIAIQSFDNGLEGVINKWNKKRVIHVKEYELKVQPGEATEKQVSDAADALWKEFTKDHYDILASDSIRSVILDTGDETWELLRLASFGKQSANVQNYGPVNAEYRRWINSIKGTDKNLCMLHKMKDEWVGREDANGRYKASKTGKLERSGFKEIGYILQGNFQTWRDGDNQFHGTMLDCRQNPDIDGVDFTGEMLNFQQIAMMVFPNSEPNEWE